VRACVRSLECAGSTFIWGGADLQHHLPSTYRLSDAAAAQISEERDVEGSCWILSRYMP